MSSLTLEEIQAKHYEQLKKLAQEHFDDMKQFDEARVTIELSNLIHAPWPSVLCELRRI